jgi:hypothetical protein
MTKKAFEMLPLAFAMSHGASQRRRCGNPGVPFRAPAEHIPALFSAAGFNSVPHFCVSANVSKTILFERLARGRLFRVEAR